MASSSLAILEEACGRLPHTTRAMFGGHGLFAPNGGMFAAVVDEDRIALKLPDDLAPAFLALGGTPWTYRGRATMGGWYVLPDRLYDDAHELASWARQAHATAKPAKKKARAARGAARDGSGPMS